VLDPLLGKVGDRMVGPGRAELEAAVGAPPVVMGLVPAENRPQVPFAENEHPVGDLGRDGDHEPFRISVRARAARQDLHHLDTGISQHRVKRGGELPGPCQYSVPVMAGSSGP
jgi:hypothetical protein